mgnify:CR=1 FL=1
MGRADSDVNLVAVVEVAVKSVVVLVLGEVDVVLVLKVVADVLLTVEVMRRVERNGRWTRRRGRS